MIEIEKSANNEVIHEETYLQPSYRVDKRQFTEREYNKFVKLRGVRDWSTLSWKDVRKPYEGTTFAKKKRNGNQKTVKYFPFILHGKCLIAPFMSGL